MIIEPSDTVNGKCFINNFIINNTAGFSVDKYVFISYLLLCFEVSKFSKEFDL